MRLFCFIIKNGDLIGYGVFYLVRNLTVIKYINYIFIISIHGRFWIWVV